MYLIFFRDMEDIQLTIISGGHWEGIMYKGGNVNMALVQKNLSYEELLSRVHGIVCADLNSFVFIMTALCNTGSKITKFKINNDRDIHFILGQAVDKLEVYVIVLPSQQPIQQPP